MIYCRYGWVCYNRQSDHFTLNSIQTNELLAPTTLSEHQVTSMGVFVIIVNNSSIVHKNKL